MTTEPEWTPEQAAHAESLTLLEEQTHHPCGGFLPETTRTDVARDVQETAARCEDCAAIASYRKQRHAPHLDEKGRVREGLCDCADVHVYVAEYVPLTDDPDDDPEGGE